MSVTAQHPGRLVGDPPGDVNGKITLGYVNVELNFFVHRYPRLHNS
jgi:hypothetical protein